MKIILTLVLLCVYITVSHAQSGFFSSEQYCLLKPVNRFTSFNPGKIIPKWISVPSNPATFLLKPSGYAQSLGFFCRNEILMDKKTNVPIRFRLGTYEYVRKVESY